MTDAITIALQLFGLAGLIGGCLAFGRNRRDVPAAGLSLTAWRVTLLVGTVLALLSFFARYPLDATHRILGFPFMAAAWEKHGDYWQDFVGPLTFPAYVANAVFAFMLPQLILRIRSRRGERLDPQ